MGQKSATIDPEIVAAWWDVMPDANIGVYLAPSGLCAIDIDPRNGGSESIETLEAEHGEIYSDVLAYTGGGGEHRVFEAPTAGGLPGKLAPGVDVKLDGYIIVEPSNHPSGGSYQWEGSSDPLEGALASPLPDWIRGFQSGNLTGMQLESVPGLGVQRRLLDPRDELQLAEALDQLEAHDRDEWLQVGMALHRDVDHRQALDIWHRWSEKSSKYDPDDQIRVWYSLRRNNLENSLGLATIFHLAKEAIAKRNRVGQPGVRAIEPGSSIPANSRLGRAVSKRLRIEKIQAGETDLTGVDNSEFALADEFVSEYGERFRYTHGMGWMVQSDDQSVWARDTGLKHFQSSRAICSAAAQRMLAESGDDPSNPKKGILQIATRRATAAVVDLARADQRINVSVDSWNSSSEHLNTPGGVIDLTTGSFIERSSQHRFTQVTSVSPDFTGRAIRFERFVGEIFRGDLEIIEFCQRWLGYCLTGDRSEQKIVFAHGAGANGKSTLFDLFFRIIGPYGYGLRAAALMREAALQHTTDLASLHGRRVAFSTELDEGLHLDESKVKQLTGDEFLTARFMRQDNFEFRMTQKHILIGNHRPRFHGGDFAMARRMLLLPFEQRFEGAQMDPRLPDRLKAEQAQILAWCIAGAVKWYESGLAVPESIKQASANYMSDNDDIKSWIAESCVADPSAMAKASELYGHFKIWKLERGERVPSMRLWGERMSSQPGIQKKKSGSVKYFGIALNATAKAHYEGPYGPVTRVRA